MGTILVLVFIGACLFIGNMAMEGEQGKDGTGGISFIIVFIIMMIGIVMMVSFFGLDAGDNY